jgi:choline dehydrogenase
METFDYVVVGGGTAGCVVATRLSEDPAVSVLLLEAGGDERRPDVETPERWLDLMGSDVDWAYETVVQEATGRAVPTPRGKVLGGSGSTNGMTYLRGHRYDYQEWAELGADGWDYAGVLPYFKRAEDVPTGDPRFHGRGGPLHPAPASLSGWLGDAWCEGARRLGYPLADDFNGADMLGAGRSDSLIHNGVRESTASAYLRPAMGRANLTVHTHAIARRLSIERERCGGVEYLRGGVSARVAAGQRGRPMCRGNRFAAATDALGDRCRCRAASARHRAACRHTRGRAKPPGSHAPCRHPLPPRAPAVVV